MFLTSNLRVLSDRSGRMKPHCHSSWIRERRSARSAFWLTEKLGRTSQPNRCRRLGWNETQKHPSPSTNPDMYAERFIGKGSGPACYGALSPHPGISPLSRYGDRVIAAILPSVLPAAPARRRWGFTDLSRLMSAIARTPGSSIYPTRNFAQLVLKVSQEAGLYLDSDFGLRILDVKSLRVPCDARAFPADCPHVRLIFTACGEHASTGRLCEEIPAYGPVLLRLAMTNLRTVIVTAAVYRGFSLRLRLAADHAL